MEKKPPKTQQFGKKEACTIKTYFEVDFTHVLRMRSVTFLGISVFVSLFGYQCICQSIWVSVYLSVYLGISVFVSLFGYQCICQSIWVSVYLSVYLLIKSLKI